MTPDRGSIGEKDVDSHPAKPPVDDLEGTVSSSVEEISQNLSSEHRQYLLDRHGTLDLQPLPDRSDADPYNWRTSKVRRRH